MILFTTFSIIKIAFRGSSSGNRGKEMIENGVRASRSGLASETGE
jgi:hypothetical protein